MRKNGNPNLDVATIDGGIATDTKPSWLRISATSFVHNGNCSGLADGKSLAPDTVSGAILPAAYVRVCEHCGGEYVRPKNRGRFCSYECCYKARTGKPLKGFTTPDSEREERIRANGLINKRLKMGWFTKPTACMKCGAAKRLDSHHTDYSKPDHVFWLCRSCHMLAHREADFLTGMKPFVCDQKVSVAERYHARRAARRSSPSPSPAAAKAKAGAQ
jgi:hypothetical protein